MDGQFVGNIYGYITYRHFTSNAFAGKKFQGHNTHNILMYKAQSEQLKGPPWAPNGQLAKWASKPPVEILSGPQTSRTGYKMTSESP